MAHEPRPERVLMLAIGNPFCGDDGVGQHVANRMQSLPAEMQSAPVEMRVAMPGGRFAVEYRQQMTPELAERIAGQDVVVILNADPAAKVPFLSEVGEAGPTAFTLGPTTHCICAEVLAQLSRALYRWKGRMLLCHLPARDFSPGVQLSQEAADSIESAIALLGTVTAGKPHLDPAPRAVSAQAGA